MSFPFHGKVFQFTQPDGTKLSVRGWGDQNHAVFETLDGYTVLKDPLTGFYNYASPLGEGGDLRSTGVRAGLTSPAALGLTEKLRGSPESEQVFAAIGNGLPVPRWKERIQQQKLALHSVAMAESAGAILPAPPARQTVGSYFGLCLLIQFPDVPGSISQAEVINFCNETGYSGFGNSGSVYDYFLDNSVGKLKYTTVVTPYFTASHNRDYYTNPQVPYGLRARELILDALAYHKSQGFNFSSLTADPTGAVYATSIFYAGDVVNNWSEGLWPHASRLTSPFNLGATFAVDYQITGMGAVLELGTYCHENGHMLCDFPDLYNYADQRRGVGQYCLMCGGGNANPRNPHQVGAYLKYRAGWGNPAASLSAGTRSITAGQNEFFIFSKSSTEYFIIENRQQSGRDSTLSDAGLTIWHIDELGSNSQPQTAPIGHQRFECVLVQADGRNDLATGANQGDGSDLFRAGLLDRFNDNTTPSAKWWDGQDSGLSLRNISASSLTMNFEST